MSLAIQDDVDVDIMPHGKRLRERYVRNVKKWRALKSSIDMVDNGRAMLTFMEHLAAVLQDEIDQGSKLHDKALAAFKAADYVAGGLSPELQQLSVELLCLHWQYGPLLRRWYQAAL